MSSERKGFVLSVAGYLHVRDKRAGRSFKRRWCWFDERTCSLKCYKDQAAYANHIDEPVGEIKLASAKITPTVIEGIKDSSNQFVISNDEGLYQLQAKDNKEALEWIRRLQDKRSEYHKVGAAREHHDEAIKAQTVPRTPGRGRLMEGSPETSPVGVRKIMEQILSPPSTTASPFTPASEAQGTQRLSLVEGMGGALPWTDDGALARMSVCSSDITDGNSLQMSLPNDEQLQLEYSKSQEISTMYYKEIQKLKQKLEMKDLKISALDQEITELKEQISSMNVPIKTTQLQEEKASLELTLKQLLESIKVIVHEVDQHKEQAQLNEKKIMKEKKRNAELERSINYAKKNYVQFLTESLSKSASMMHLRDNPETVRNPRLVELLKEEGWETEGVFEDEYGDVHDWNNGVSVQHFLCRCLYLHYTQHEQEALSAEWEACLKGLSKTSSISSDKSKELRNLLRRSLPTTFRKEVWTILVNRHVARTREVKDHTGGGGSYYQSLLNTGQQSACRKQINLDLHRTMPYNKYFRRGGLGITQLENVLIAYSIHNKTIGYCQGMNMIAALGLLFLDEETTFWYMVAIIEVILPSGYYGPGLLGAQADQAVMKEVLATQIVDLAEHMSAYYIDITLVTFNWFLTLFIDAVPTECALRIMDVFLNEGHKVLYRMAIGILKLYKDQFLSMTDPVSLLQLLKEISRRTYTVEDIFSAAFDTGFPKKSYLNGRHTYHMNLFRQEWQARLKETQLHKEAAVAALPATSPPPQPSAKKVPEWECGCTIRTDTICLCSGEKDQGSIAVITIRPEPHMEIISDLVIKGRVVCMKYIPSCDMILIGTLDFYVYAVDCLTWKKLWSLRLIDSVLNMEAVETTVFFALAEGSVAIIKGIDRSYPLSEPILLHVGSTSVPCLALIPNQMLWCGSEKSITVLSTITCELEKSIIIDDDDDDLGKIYKMKYGQEGVWVSFKSSTIICLFDVNHYAKVLQIDYATLPSSETHDRITSLLPVQGYLWLGTGDGTVHILSVKAKELAHQEEGLAEGTPAGPKAPESNAGGGLVTTVEEEEEEGGEKNESEGVGGKEVGGTSAEKPHLLPMSRLHRKSKFGTTLRHRKRPISDKKDVNTGAYELAIEASKHVVESRKEPVRTLQTCLGPDNSTIVVSSVHTNSNKAVQLWRYSGQDIASWDMVYLPYCGK